MAGDNRGSSSLFRRAEQLKRWQESETNKQDVTDRPKKRKVKFSDGCIFLAAGAAGDKEELKRLLEKGADINTVNQDGITALHAACIDNNLEIVEFLVDNNADINRCDMEGWTPLHATASCGSLSMAEFLISRGADLSVVNNDGELAIDVVDEDDMAKLLQEEMDKRGIDCDASRSREERQMLEDAQSWLNCRQVADVPHPKTGATALHVAAAKGYIKVIRLLVDAGVNIDTKDFDGWTPLHAAAHWGQTEAVEILCDNMADMDILNNVGQTAYDLADDTMKPWMDELRRKQASTKLITPSKNLSRKRKPSPPRGIYKKEKEAVRRESDGTSSDESSEHEVEKRSSGRVDSSVDQSEVQSWRRPSLKNKSLHEERNSREETVKGVLNTSTSYLNHKENEVVLRKDSGLKEERNCQDILRVSDNHVTTTPSANTVSSSPTRLVNSSSLLTPNGGLSNLPPPPKRIPSTPSTPTTHTPTIHSLTSELPTTPDGSQQSTSKLSAGSVIKNFFNLLHSSRSFAPPIRDEESETQRKAHAKMVRSTRRSTQGITLEDLKSAEQLMKSKTTATATTTTTTTTPSTISTTPPHPSFTNTSTTTTITSPFTTNQSASATIEVISANTSSSSSSNSTTTTTATGTVSGTSSLSSVVDTTAANTASSQDSSGLSNGVKDDSKRPSWRLKVDSNDKNRFSLEDVRPKAKERVEFDIQVTDNVTLPLKKTPTDEKKEEKVEDKSSTTREGTQAVIQRRKKAKRRSTGVVHVDLDEIDPHRKSERREDDDTGTEDGSVSDRESTSSKSATPTLLSKGGSRGPGSHNGDIDYKKLYEEQLSENDKLMERLREHEKDLRVARETIENNSKVTSARSALAESERREKRALERKLSEMEEELRQLQKLKAENEKLRAENRALTRVVSKLTSSAAGSMGGHLSALTRLN